MSDDWLPWFDFSPLAIFLFQGYLRTALRMDDTDMITGKGYGFLNGSTISIATVSFELQIQKRMHRSDHRSHAGFPHVHPFT
jgi:hypothetical protein